MRRVLVAIALGLISSSACAQSVLWGTDLRIVEQPAAPPNLAALGRIGLWSPDNGVNKGKPLWRNEDGTDSVLGKPGGLTYTVGPAGSGATFTTIQAAIDAAVAAGAAFGNAVNVYILGGIFVENISLKDGVFLVGSGNRLGVELVGSVTLDATAAAILGAGISGVTVIASNANAITLVGASGIGLYVENCYLQTQSPGFHVIGDAGGGANAITINNAYLNGYGSAIEVGAASSTYVFNSRVYTRLASGNLLASSGTTYIRTTLFEQQGTASGVGVSVLAGTATLIDVDVHTVDGGSDGASIASGAHLNTYDSVWRVPAGGLNNAIRGVASSFLNWSGLTFTANNNVSTTTMGANAVHVVVDSITAN